MNKRIMTIISVAIAIALFLGGIEVMTRLRLDLVKVPVLKAIKDDRTLISEDDIKWMTYPKKSIDDKVILKKEELKDLYVKLNHTLYPNQPISLDSVEILSISHDDAILRLNEDQVVLSLKSDLTQSFGGMLNVGHRVNINVVHQSRGEIPTSQLFLKQVRVIGAKDKKGQNVAGDEIPAVVLLAISKDALQPLLEMQAEADLVMTLVERDLEEECIIEEGFTLE